MTTLKSKVFNFMVRNRHIFRGQLKKEVFDLNTSIEAFRERCEKGAARMGKLPNDINVTPVSIDGLYAEWLTPGDVNPGKIMMYVHGGGYVSGSCSDHRGIVAKFAKAAGVNTLLYEYRLAPEHPYPAAVDDSVTVYRWLLDNGYSARNILIVGESAGGGLCLATLLALKEQNIHLPVAAVAISPWTDLACTGESYRTKNKVSPAPLYSWNVFSHHYIGKDVATNPLISPLYGEPKGLPPTFINSAVDDELYDDGEKFYLKAKAAGVDIQFRAGEGMIHCYPLLAPMFKEATEAMEEIVDFIRKHLNIN